ncbi:hypothetical protein HK405_014175 [Cladochytrium tenue]|nr:hypothetical protein HK405_014175 [Cladochytrium tenue]
MSALDPELFLLVSTLNALAFALSPPAHWIDPVLRTTLAPFLLFLGAHYAAGRWLWTRAPAVHLTISFTILLNVGVAVPRALFLADHAVASASGATGLQFPPVPLAAIPLRVLGLALIAGTVWQLAAGGDGTLSPGSGLQTRRLVTSGAYAYVRNPMIVGVAMELAGLALEAGSLRLYSYAAAFVAVKTVWFGLCEEPNMRARFGREYERYHANVGMWLPRFSPYVAAAPPDKTD